MLGCSELRKTLDTAHLQILVSISRPYYPVKETYVAIGKPSIHLQREHIF